MRKRDGKIGPPLNKEKKERKREDLNKKRTKGLLRSYFVASVLIYFSIFVFIITSFITIIRLLKKNRKYALLLFFVAAAILAPPDVITQVLMALPLMVLYEISIIGAKIFGKKKPEEEKTKDAEKSTA